MTGTNRHILKIATVVFVVAVVTWSCGKNQVEIVNKELIFDGSQEIKVFPYRYTTDSILFYTVSGDSGFSLNGIDTVSSMPVLEWDTVRSEIVIAAIFSDPIQTNQTGITNDDDIVWIWHSGLESGENKRCEYIDGYGMIDSDIDNLVPPIPLQNGHIYFWGVWAYDAAGIRVIYSSRMLRFFVE